MMDDEEIVMPLIIMAMIYVAVLGVFSLVKIGATWFDVSPANNYGDSTYLDRQSTEQCKKKHGTVVLEDHGEHYKECKI